MKPDWCDEATWNDALRRCERFEGEQSEREIIQTVARALIAAKNEGLEEAAQIAEWRKNLYKDGASGDPRLAISEAVSSIRSRIQKAG